MREGYSSERVNPSWRAKDKPGLQVKFHKYGYPTTRDNLNARLHSKGMETIRKLTRVGGLRACLQGGRVTQASGLTLVGGQKIARVYKQNFTGRVTLQPGTT